MSSSATPPEKLLTKEEVVALLSPPGRTLNPRRVYGWVNDGVRGVRLECVRLPSGMFFTREQVAKFRIALNRAVRGAEPGRRRRK